MSVTGTGKADRISDAPPIIRIHPEPSADELVAIVAAVAAALRSATMEERAESAQSRWACAARDEALRARQDARTKTS